MTRDELVAVLKALDIRDAPVERLAEALEAALAFVLERGLQFEANAPHARAAFAASLTGGTNREGEGM